MIKFFFTENYNKSLEKIEDFIFDSTESLTKVERFLDEHDKTLNFIAANPRTAAIDQKTRDQSWPCEEGRYRIFFKVVETVIETKIFLIDIIDNKEANLKVYPNNSLPTYTEED